MNKREQEREWEIIMGLADDYEDYDDEPVEWCTWCDGDGWDDQCHEEGCYCLEGHHCAACGGSGLAKDQTIW